MQQSGEPKTFSPWLTRALVGATEQFKRHGRFEEMGELAIQFGSLDELNGFIDRLRGTGR